MSFFRVAVPPPKASHANDCTIHSDSDNDVTPTQTKREASPARNLFSHASSFLALQSARIAQEKKQKEREERKKREKSEERRERRIKKEKKDKSKRKSGDGEEDSEGKVKKEGDLKKRRISGKEGEALLRKALGGTRTVDLGSSDDEDVAGNGVVMDEQEAVLPVRRSTRRPRPGFEHGSPASKSRPKQPIADGDDDDLQITSATTVRRPSPPLEEEDSDPEIAALTRNARAAAAQRRLAAAAQPPHDQRTSTPTTNDLPTASSTSTPTGDHADPIVSILVSSPMSKGVMIIRRRISQTLGAVREAYCKRWEFPDPDSIFLTFCGRKLYDSTTCRRFGLVVDAQGNVSWSGRNPSLAVGEVEQEPGQVHVEAVDEAWFKQIREERERERRHRTGEVLEEEQEDATAEAEGKKEEYIKLVVKAKGKRDFKLKVTPTTVFQKIIMASKKSFELPEDAEVWLEFDGERLDPKADVASVEIEDMDCLELFVAK